jgi:hypothetical protein
MSIIGGFWYSKLEHAGPIQATSEPTGKPVRSARSQLVDIERAILGVGVHEQPESLPCLTEEPFSADHAAGLLGAQVIAGGMCAATLTQVDIRCADLDGFRLGPAT